MLHSSRAVREGREDFSYHGVVVGNCSRKLVHLVLVLVYLTVESVMFLCQLRGLNLQDVLTSNKAHHCLKVTSLSCQLIQLYVLTRVLKTLDILKHVSLIVNES